MGDGKNKRIQVYRKEDMQQQLSLFSAVVSLIPPSVQFSQGVIIVNHVLAEA